MKRAKYFNFWSNILFLIPAGLAVYFRIWIIASLIILVMIFSLLYHYFEERCFREIDAFLAWMLIFSNLYISYLGNFKKPYFAIALIFVAVALISIFFIEKRSYLWGHGLWHIFSVFITTFCILTLTA